VSIPEDVITAIRDARHVVALTGSGASAESGVPTFREAQAGLWEKFNPHELATPEAFLQDPALVWSWYRWRRELVARAKPNRGHYALAALARTIPIFSLITQNVDGLHQRAGSNNVMEYHGNLFDTRCFSRDCAVADADVSAAAPRCPNCGDLLRPGVVWFGEPIPPAVLDAATRAVVDCDVFLSVGTSSLVWPAAGLLESARAAGATIIEVNTDVTPHTSQSHYSLQGKSGEILAELVNCLRVQLQKYDDLQTQQ